MFCLFKILQCGLFIFCRCHSKHVITLLLQGDRVTAPRGGDLVALTRSLVFTAFASIDRHESFYHFSISQTPCKLARCQFPRVKMDVVTKRELIYREASCKKNNKHEHQRGHCSHRAALLHPQPPFAKRYRGKVATFAVGQNNTATPPRPV